MRKAFTGKIIAQKNVIYAVIEDSVNSFPMLLKSTDSGITWSESEIAAGELDFETIALDPQNSDILYIGGYNTSSEGTNGFIFKTIDGETFWSTGGWSGKRIFDLCINPFNSYEIYCGTNWGIYKSTDAGISWKHINTDICVALYIDGQHYYKFNNNTVAHMKEDGVIFSEYTGTTGFHDDCFFRFPVEPGESYSYISLAKGEAIKVSVEASNVQTVTGYFQCYKYIIQGNDYTTAFHISNGTGIILVENYKSKGDIMNLISCEVN